MRKLMLVAAVAGGVLGGMALERGRARGWAVEDAFVTFELGYQAGERAATARAREALEAAGGTCAAAHDVAAALERLAQTAADDRADRVWREVQAEVAARGTR